MEARPDLCEKWRPSLTAAEIANAENSKVVGLWCPAGEGLHGGDTGLRHFTGFPVGVVAQNLFETVLRKHPVVGVRRLGDPVRIEVDHLPETKRRLFFDIGEGRNATEGQAGAGRQRSHMPVDVDDVRTVMTGVDESEL